MSSSPRLDGPAIGIFDTASCPDISIYNERGSLERYSFRENEQIWVLADVLTHECSHAEVVAIVMPTGEGLIAAWFAVLAAGKTPVILQNYNRKQHLSAWRVGLSRSLANAGATCLIMESNDHWFQGLAEFQIVYWNDVDWQQTVEARGSFVFQHTDRFIQLSSGTTGHRKAVEFEVADVIRHINDYAGAMEYRSDDVIVAWLPLYHDMGFVACFLASVFCRIPLVLLDNMYWVRQPSVLFDKIRVHNGTLVYMPNFGFELLSRADSSPCETMRRWISCSEPSRRSSLMKFSLRHLVAPSRISTCYAMAENIFAVSQSDGIRSNGIDGQDTISCGKLIPGVRAKIVDGEVWVSSLTAIKQYVGGADIRDADGFYPTGDLGDFVSDELYISGRKADVAIIAGRKFLLSDIDAAANNLDDWVKGRVTSIALFDPRLGTDTVTVLIERSDFFAADNIATDFTHRLQESIGLDSLECRLVPPRFISKTTSGKVNRKQTARDWISADWWRGSNDRKERRPLTVVVGEALPGVDWSRPAQEVLDSLGIVVLSVVLADYGVPFDPNLPINMMVENASIEGLEADLREIPSLDTVRIVHVGERATAQALEELHLRALASELNVNIVYEHIVAPPAPVLLNDLIFFDYFMTRVIPVEGLGDFEDFVDIVGRIKSADVLITDDVSEFALTAGQSHLALAHDGIRQPEADLVAFREYRYLRSHHRLPARVIHSRDLASGIDDGLVSLSQYLDTPVVRIAVLEQWADDTSGWEVPAHSVSHPLPPLPWPIDANQLVTVLRGHLHEVQRLKAPDAYAVPAVKILYEGMPHMCINVLKREKLNDAIRPYDRVLVIGPAASVPYLQSALETFGKTALHSVAVDFTLVGITEGDFDCVMQSGSWGRPPTSKPVYQLLGAGWEDAQWLSLQGHEHHFVT